jgi:hypothetical protein
MSCEQARKHVEDFLKEQGADEYVSADQLDDLVRECCDDVWGQGCQEALSTVAATAVCSVYTEGACVPCCETLGAIVGPIVAKGVAASVELLKGAWEGLTEAFTTHSYSYSKVYDELLDEYTRATQGLAIDGLAQAWLRMRLEGLGHGTRMPIVAPKGPGGLYVPVFEDDPDAVKWDDFGIRWDEAWEYILLYNAAILTAHAYPNGYEQVEDPFGKLMSFAPPPQKFKPTGREFFAFRWYGNQSPDLWFRNADAILNVRYEFVEKAMARFVSDAMQMTTLEMVRKGVAAKLMEAKPDLLDLKPHPEQASTSPMLIAAGVVALIGLGYAGYRYRDVLFKPEKRP